MAKPRPVRKYGSDKPSGDPSAPSAEDVDKLHTNAAVDSRPEDIHHTLGPGSNQASPGPHSHDGSDSVQLLAGETISGSRSDGTALFSVIRALVKLGITDSSTP